MPMIIKGGKRYCSSSNLAEDIIYDNENSGLEATNTQEAIDELKADIQEAFQLGTSRKTQLISSLPSKFGLTSTSTWSDIFNKLSIYYPNSYEVISNLAKADWIFDTSSYSGNTASYKKGGSLSMTASRLGGVGNYCKATSASIDITPFSQIVCNFSSTGSKNKVQLSTTDGTLTLRNGVTTSLKKYSGDAKIIVYCETYDSNDDDPYYEDGVITVNTITFKA